MRQSQKFFEATDISLYRRYLQQMLIMTGLLLFFLSSGSAFAIEDNPGAVCDSNFSQGSLTNPDYTNLATAVNTSNYVDIAGNDSGSIPLQIKIDITESNGPPTGNSSFTARTVSSKGVFNVFRDFPSMTSVTSIDLDFRNSITEQPIFLTNVALSAFDIDFANSSNSNIFDDYVLFTGVTSSGSTINGNYQAVAGSNIRSFDDSRPNTTGVGLYAVNNTANCPASSLSTNCQGSVKFSEPVKSVKIRYTNANYRIFGNPTNQEVFLSLDNYCYVPQYYFSGTVFNDNGGITNTQADANNANINSGTYFNKPNYFNGVFNSPQESGISGSSIRLTNCANTSTNYGTQSVVSNGTTIGQYRFSVPISTFNNNTNICLIESSTNTTFPIRTTSENINTGFSTTKYNYPDNNFGRVIAANAAIVLRKAQYVNNCPATLNYSASNINTSGNTDPRVGFSESGINGSNLIPGQCIAYRITATNRANLPVNNFVMRDKLQTKEDGALVTSFLIGPTFNDSDYATNSVAIGQNGSVITKGLTLNPRASRNFYFNTKYGTTNGSTP
ncbi:hypothetical protein ACS8E3_03020 [Psychrobacter sp. 2Y5]|uniref:hypothetical protein n=1 Tax=unclassified Psychrobacter TaxID=196806 RepID=UPI003F44B1E5